MESDFVCFYEDSMKMYLADVVGSGRPGKLQGGRCLQPSTCSPTSNQRQDSGSMTTVASQSLQPGSVVEEFGVIKETREGNEVPEDAVFDLSTLTLSVAEVPDLITMVKETFPIKEIWSRKLRTWLTTGMMVICDSSGTEREVMLWGKQCRHLLFVSTGCVMHLRKLTASRYQDRIVLKALGTSELSYLGHISDMTCNLASVLHPNLPYECMKLKQYFPNFCTKPPETLIELPLQYANLNPGSITHLRGKLIAVCTRGHDIHDSLPFCVTLSVAGVPEPLSLYLHGSSKLWKKKLMSRQTMMWEFFYLACCSSPESEQVELHTTVISQTRPVGCCKHSADQTSFPDDSICSYNELISCKQQPRKFTLSGIVAKTVSCTIGPKHYVLISDSPCHLIPKVAEKCLKSTAKASVEISAECFFKGDSVKKKLRVKIRLNMHKATELASILSEILQGEGTFLYELDGDDSREEEIALNLVDILDEQAHESTPIDKNSRM